MLPEFLFLSLFILSLFGFINSIFSVVVKIKKQANICVYDKLFTGILIIPFFGFLVVKYGLFIYSLTDMGNWHSHSSAFITTMTLNTTFTFYILLALGLYSLLLYILGKRGKICSSCVRSIFIIWMILIITASLIPISFLIN